MGSKKRKKKEPTFKKIEGGMIFTSEDKIMVGLPTEVETRTQAGAGVSIIGGKAKGERYTKVKYDWRIISGSPLPIDEMERLKETITQTSGTIVDSLSNASPINLMPRGYCRKCGFPLYIVGEGFNCLKCGEPTI